MAENLDVLDEQDVLPVLEVRVLDKNRKSSFRLRRFTNFPAAETVKDMKTALQLHMPDIKDVENWQIGYVLDRNKKYAIETDDELKNACVHFKQGYQMWLDTSPIKPAASKRQADKTAPGKL
jgi:hypothetical protein